MDFARALGWALAFAFVALLAFAVLRLSGLWMMMFGSVIVAVIIRSIADPLIRYVKLGNGLAVLAAILVIVAVLALIGHFFGREIGYQSQILAQQLPSAWAEFQTELQESPVFGRLVGMLDKLWASAGRALAIAPGVAMSVAAAVTAFVLVVVAGIFLALQPAQARDGVLSMAPKPWRPRLREVMNASGSALKGWLRGQLLSMVLVGVLVGFGLSLIGVPAPAALGLVVGLAEFVPIVGPIVGSVPGLLVAATEGWETFLLALVLYAGISQIEANLITPLVQKNVAHLPVLLGIFAVIGLGALLGPLGVLFATPLALVGYTFVTMLYRQDVLGGAEAVAPGQALTRPLDAGQ
jgi:predicted PurR-regulated permease PerM